MQVWLEQHADSHAKDESNEDLVAPEVEQRGGYGGGVVLHAGQAQLNAGGAAHILGLEGVGVVAEGGHHLRLPQEADVLLLGGQVQGMLRGHLLTAAGKN